MTNKIVLFFFILSVSLAQNATEGIIAGKIVDQSGAMVHNATIAITDVLSKETREGQPHIGGLYRLVGVKPGVYQLKVTAEGFRPFVNPKVVVSPGESVRVDASLRPGKADEELTVTTDQTKTSRRSAMFDDVPMVAAATLRLQTLKEAPANVSVISAGDIRRFGYRTLGEALQSVRGFYFSNDRIYNYGGVRGINTPGDYNSRFLVMVNGHSMTENIYNSSNFFGQDFGLDMDLVDRIEVIRGPSSALYGSNGMLTTINVVTKSPVETEKYRVSTETGSFSERKLIFSTSQYLGHGANLLFSGSGFNSGRKSLYLPQYDSPFSSFGRTSNNDIERGYHTFTNVTVGDWRFTAYFNSREKLPPVSWADALFDTHGNRVRDTRNFAEAAFQRKLANGATFRWNLSYDNYRYNDRFFFEGTRAVEDFRTRNWGDWVTSQASYSFKPFDMKRLGATTFGAQGRFEVRSLQTFEQAAPVIAETNRVSQPDRTVGAFLQQEFELTKQLSAYVGVRFDASKNYQSAFSPQASLIYQPDANTAIKLVAGRPFRNPSAFEQFWEDRSPYLRSGGLRPERAQTLEASVERKLNKTLSAIVNVYQYRIDHLIRAVQVTDEFQQYQNTGAYRSTGAEFEISARPRSIQIDASWSLQRAYQLGTRDWLENSPRHLGKGRIAIPLFRDTFHLSNSFYYMGKRSTRALDTVGGFVLWDLTLVSTKLHKNFDFQAGIRNLLNKRYEDPVALFIARIQRDGRTYYVKLIAHMSE